MKVEIFYKYGLIENKQNSCFIYNILKAKKTQAPTLLSTLIY